MTIAYLDCTSGISGDMMLGALVDAGAELGKIQAGIDSLGLPTPCRLRADEVRRCGFRGLKITVEHEPEHAHRHLHHITRMIDSSQLTPRAKDLATRIFTRLGEAEAKVHGVAIEKVHFHEVGAVDSIADIVGTAIGLDLLGIDRVISSSVPTGTGIIQIAHGRCQVPAPATAQLLHGVPLAESSIEVELTTPTGAAILATVVERFGPLPAMTIDRIGCGAGDRDLKEQPNLLRLILGQAHPSQQSDQVVVLETNLDDVTGEVIGHAVQCLLDGGALDVYTSAIQMKKNRPATKITVLCRTASVPDMESILFRETRTLGMRRWVAERTVLRREESSVQTRWGPVRGKRVTLAEGSSWFSPEYEDCRAIAAREQIALQVVIDEAARIGTAT